MSEVSRPSRQRVLTVSYSQSGQLNRILNSICGELAQRDVVVTKGTLRPAQDFPFPWPVLQFFNQFPETVYEDGPSVELVDEGGEALRETEFDLVIIGFQVWFLAPSLPVSSFLKSAEAAELLFGTRVITVIGCRNMWLMAQERMKRHLARMNAHLIDNVVLTDSGQSVLTFISTPLWVLTGRKGPWLGGLIPRAGVSDVDVASASRFGVAIAEGLSTRDGDDRRPMLAGLGAVRVNPGFIGAEKAGQRSFAAWGALLRWIGPPSSMLRRAVLLIFVVYLVVLIVTIVPLAAMLRWVSSLLFREGNAKKRQYYAQPSGE